MDLFRTDIHPEQTGDSGNYTQWDVLCGVYHDDFNGTTYDNDIALLFIDANLTTFDEYQEVSIPHNVTYNKSCCHDKELFTVVGYGYDEYHGIATDTLQYTEIAYMNKTECNIELTRWYAEHRLNESNAWVNNTNYWEFTTESQFCAIGNNTDACSGDSGGPVMRKGTNQQIGITSTGFECNRGIPAIYTNVGLFANGWIQSHLDHLNLDACDLNKDDDSTANTTNMTNMTSTVETEDENGEDLQQQNVQLAIGCSVALCVLCFCVMVYMVRSMRKKKKSQKYNRMDSMMKADEKAKKKQTKVSKKRETDGEPLTTSVQSVEVEMNETKLISNADLR